MSFETFSAKRPNAAEIFGFDFINTLGPNEHIVSVNAVITLKGGVTDPNMNTMKSGTTLFADEKVWQLVAGGLSDNYYFITFTVTTTTQLLEAVGVIPVSSGVSI